jgi:outer membrane protein OmpA-like peptidoglycan-associated protein
MRFFIKTILIILILLINNNFAFAQKVYTGPEDKRAIEESEKAVKRLGHDRGAIPIVTSVVDIVGLESVSFSGSSTGLTQTLKDLGAKQVGAEIQISLSGDVLFDFDKWVIKKEAEVTLRKLAKAIKELNKKNVIIEGHTDSKGSESYNIELSHKRAEAVRDWLLSKGDLKSIKLQTKGYGESRPVAPNINPDGSDNIEGRAKNRRVEIKISD